MVFFTRPDQTEKLQKLEQVHGQLLDENTRLYAKYYKDCMNFDSATSKKVIPMLPIVEAPMTPLHEVSRSIPDYVKFGPILPKSTGFSRFSNLETMEEKLPGQFHLIIVMENYQYLLSLFSPLVLYCIVIVFRNDLFK